jgi:plasmid stabilization system protein ParE
VPRKLVYRPRAAEDLDTIYDWIADYADPGTALGITGRIEAHCEKLVDFPERGTPRDDVRAGLRTTVIGKAVIAYMVDSAEVAIVHIKYGGQELREENLGEDA